ncbi:hypothetical protein B0H11DRAFT_2030487 [Mycena galericulata]|nr:hypothetical protein B0H11DRAFT_2030487 [Mycena galericulata]
MGNPLDMLPFYDSKDTGYEITPKSATARDTSIQSHHPHYYRKYLYSAILEATARQQKSLRDLPVELITKIFEMSVMSSRSTGLALALAAPWISNMIFLARLAHVSLRTKKQISSFHSLVCASGRAGGAVRTLWISDSVEWPAETLIPDILRACQNLRALGCRLDPLQRLCDSQELFPTRLLSVQITLTEFMGVSWHSPVSKWTHLIQTTHGTVFLHNITHLRLVHHHYLFEETFPAEHFPRLTHLAMGSEKRWSRSPAEYTAHIRSFAHSLERVWKATPLQLAVLVFRPFARHYSRPHPPHLWDARELVRVARECGSNILVYTVLQQTFRESYFWDECAADGVDIWSLARKQTALLSEAT